MLMNTEEKIISSVKCSIYTNCEGGSVIYFFTSSDDPAENIAMRLKKLTGKNPWKLVCIHITEWNKSLSPWAGGGEFTGGGKATLLWLTEKCIPEIEKNREFSFRFIGGYSLAGLFSLWAFCESGIFDGVASVSGSLWFEGWGRYIYEKNIPCGSIYLSLGMKEEKTKNAVMATVGDVTRETYDIISRNGNIKNHILEYNNGGHFTEPDLRTAKGFAWLINNQ